MQEQKLFLIESTVTNTIYIDTDNKCYAFLKAEDADAFVKDIAQTRVSDEKFIKMDELDQLCYASGADIVVLKAGEDSVEHTIDERRLPIAPYNHVLNRALAKIKETKEKQYLAELSISNYIVAAKIENEDGPKIVYAIAEHKLRELGKLYLAFSNLEEFSIWQSELPDWEPLRVDYTGLTRIAGKHGVMLNPSGNRLILTTEMFDDIKRLTNK